MKMRSWSESNGAMLVPSTFTGWYKNTMMTSARPMAMSRSRVQTRISLRRECIDTTRPVMALATEGPEFTIEDDAGAGVSGDVEIARSFSFGRSIFTLPCIYSMAVARRARCHLSPLSAEHGGQSGFFHSIRLTRGGCPLLPDRGTRGEGHKILLVKTPRPSPITKTDNHRSCRGHDSRVYAQVQAAP